LLGPSSFKKILEGENLFMNINNNIIEARKKKHKNKPFNSMSITTGDISLNIDRFNTAMGSLEGSEAGVGGEGALAEETKLREAKRYVRRYYFRPMNKFASNKAEVLKTLIEIGDQNCTIYTLNNLGDEKDVSKLTSNDIIYTYDDGILKDKNGIRVMDYDLSIKKEENRKKFTSVDDGSKEFRTEYEDRMTSATELEEDFDNELIDAFNDCDYEVINAGYANNGDIIVSLNHGVADIDTAAKHLMSCLQQIGIYIIDWNTNGDNVFIFTPDVDNAFDMDFDDINVFGERLTEAKETYCSICGEPVEDDGHITDDGIICDGCELHFAIGG
jgi:hypothetical protein